MKISLLGEPATGKTSYLVALYGALVNHSAPPLVLVDVEDEVGFLNEGLAAMTRLEPVGRTDADSAARAALTLDLDGAEIRLDAPDRSGELLKLMLNSRRWDDHVLGGVESVDGAILFLSPLKLDPGSSADEIRALMEQAIPADGSEDPIPWAPALMPADVRAVDLLQATLERRKGLLPLSVVISAWDCVDEGDWAPGGWLAQRLPLLQQFLATQANLVPSCVFGISAQGLDFDDKDVQSDERSLWDPWDRARVHLADGTRSTLAAPLLWLFEQAR